MKKCLNRGNLFSYLTEVRSPSSIACAVSRKGEKSTEKFVDNEGTKKDHQTYILSSISHQREARKYIQRKAKQRVCINTQVN
jgi:hypothetical protein